MTSYETLRYDVTDAVATITLHRPERMNAFTAQMTLELIEAFDRIDADDGVRAVIVTGSGKAFCAGADLAAGAATFDHAARTDRAPIPVGTDGEIDWSADAARDNGGRVTLRIFRCMKPVIAAVNGAAVGIGATMLLPMDVRIAADAARFGFVFARRGIVMEACSSWFLPRVVGISQALEWAMSGRVFSAEEALAGGLVKRVVPADALISTARDLAVEIAANTSAVSVALMRQMMWRMLGAAHPMEAHKVDSRVIRQRGRSADCKEGVTSFLEKRPARFPDKVSADMPPAYPWFEEPPYR